MDIGMNMNKNWNEHEGNEYKWKEKDMNAEWKENERKWKHRERNMKGNENKMKGIWKEINTKWKQHELLPKHLKPTKQFLERFPSLFRIWFWFHVGPYVDFYTTLERDMPLPKSDNHNNSNYSDVKDLGGNSMWLGTRI